MSACVFKVLKCTGILINCAMLEIIGNVCTGDLVNKPIVAVVASLVGSCDILWRNVHVYHMRNTLCLVWFYCHVECCSFLSCVVSHRYKALSDIGK